MGCLVPFAAIFAFGIIITAVLQSRPVSLQPENTQSNTIELVCDIEQFANITSDELVAILGEPDSIDQGVCTGAFEIPCTYYDYNSDKVLGEVSFVLVNDNVVRVTSYNYYSYAGKESVLSCFGIDKGENCAIAGDTGVSLRYRCPSETVDDFWISLIDGDVFGSLQVTYDMEYYEERYLPLTSHEEVEYKSDAELTMESLLISPATADFPWYDWEYGKNLFYILVFSYVDSENAFGVEIRNTFTFVYSRLTGEIVLAIVNDEVVANNGYIEVGELVQELYSTLRDESSENSSTNNPN